MGSINKDYKVQDVFTPTKPARATFVKREAINAKLVDALQTPGKQIVVYRHSGSGKAALLVNKLHQLYENHITTRCTSDMTFEKLLLNSFDQLHVFAEVERTEKHTYQFSPSIGAEYKSIKIQMAGSFSNESQVKNQRILPLQLTPQTLAKFLGEARCCWVLEDFHKIEQSEKQKLSQVMKLFMDMADDYSDLKIIAIGAVDTARQVVEYDPEMRNRVSEIHVPLMIPSEVREIIDKGEKLLNFTLSDDAKNDIVEYSKRVRRFDNCRLILQVLSQCDQEGAVPAVLFEKIRKRHKDYPAGSLTLHLKELQTPERGALLRYDSTSNQYSFSDPVYRVFAMSVFEKENPPRGIIDAEVTKALERVSSQLDEVKGRLELVIEQHANTPKK